MPQHVALRFESSKRTRMRVSPGPRRGDLEIDNLVLPGSVVTGGREREGEGGRPRIRGHVRRSLRVLPRAAERGPYRPVAWPPGVRVSVRARRKRWCQPSMPCAPARRAAVQCGVLQAILFHTAHARSVTRVEPKMFLANERTFINWLEMATKIGSFSAALAGALRWHDSTCT